MQFDLMLWYTYTAPLYIVLTKFDGLNTRQLIKFFQKQPNPTMFYYEFLLFESLGSVATVLAITLLFAI